MNLNFHLALLCGPSKGFIKAFKAFIKLFEAPQRSVKIKIKQFFLFVPGLGREGLNFQSILFSVEKEIETLEKLTISNRNTRKRYKICSKLTKKA